MTRRFVPTSPPLPARALAVHDMLAVLLVVMLLVLMVVPVLAALVPVLTVGVPVTAQVRVSSACLVAVVVCGDIIFTTCAPGILEILLAAC